MAPAPDPLAARSPRLFWLFGWYLRWLFWRKFDAVRVAKGGEPPAELDRPLIIYSNHPSWWDPTLYMLVATLAFPRHDSYGPMQAAALGRYAFFRRLGVFGIDPTTQGGAAAFLRVAARVLSTSRGALWITAEGAFTDPRRRPVRLRAGIAHLARRMPDAVILPLAIEYCFWNESHPEILLRFGAPMRGGRHLDVAGWTARLEAALTASMDALAADAVSRDATLFRALQRGAGSLGGIYDGYRRIRALAGGKWLDTRHEGGTR